MQERKLTMLGLRHRFELVAYVGDRLDLDALGAQAAGLTGIWLNRTGSAVPVPDGIHRITTLAELPGVLRG